MDLSDLPRVTIDFDRSHLVFPTLVAVLLGLLLVAVLVTRRRDVAAMLGGGMRVGAGRIDWLRLLGTLGLTIAYFIAMDAIGVAFPNRGLGFLFASVPYVAALSLLYLHDRSARALMVVAANAIIAPLFVWLVLSRLFNISLP